MRFDRLFIGIIVVLIGVIILGINFGWWNGGVWIYLLELWPLLLILIGVRFIFGAESPVTVILLALSLVFAIAYLSNFKEVRTNLPLSHFNVSEKAPSQSFYLSNADITDASFNVNLGAAKINIGSLDSGNDRVYEGDFSSNDQLSINDNIKNNSDQVTIKETPSQLHFGGNDDRTFNLNVKRNLPLTLNLNSGASTLNLDLSDLDLKNLEVNSGAATGQIKFGTREARLSTALSTGASSYKFLIPKDYAISITSDTALTTNNFENIGLVKNGNSYKSADFDQSVDQITLKLSAGASKFEIERY